VTSIKSRESKWTATRAYFEIPDFLDTSHMIDSAVDAEAYLSRLSQVATADSRRHGGDRLIERDQSYFLPKLKRLVPKTMIQNGADHGRTVPLAGQEHAPFRYSRLRYGW